MHDHAEWDPSGADRVIAGEGTPEAAWRAWPGLRALPTMTLDALVPEGRRAVIVAPHPDDELLGSGGLIAALLERHHAARSNGVKTGQKGREGRDGHGPHDGRDGQDAPNDHDGRDAHDAHDSHDGRDEHDDFPVLVIAVTDGTGSHPDSPLWPAPRLASVRAAETDTALAALAQSVTPTVTDAAIPVLRVRLPDGAVSAHEDTLEAFLRQHCRPDDMLFCTWRFDGHPDHEAVGRASARAASALSAQLIELPVWTWHWAQPGDPRLPWDRARRLLLSDTVTHAKRHAVQAYASQLEADPSTGAPPILPPFVLARVLRGFELFFI